MGFFRLHAWGDTLEEAFEQCVMAMFGYMTDTETVEPVDALEVEAEGKAVLTSIEGDQNFESLCIVLLQLIKM